MNTDRLTIRSPTLAHARVEASVILVSRRGEHRLVFMVCHPSSGRGRSSRVTLVLKETQRLDTTTGVSVMPLKREDVTVV